MAHHELTTPITEAQVRALRTDDTVTLQGTLYGIATRRRSPCSTAAGRRASILRAMR